MIEKEYIEPSLAEQLIVWEVFNEIFFTHFHHSMNYKTLKHEFGFLDCIYVKKMGYLRSCNNYKYECNAQGINHYYSHPE